MYEALANRALEARKAVEPLSDAGLKQLTDSLRQRLGMGTTARDLLPDAFAAVSEASRRVTGTGCMFAQLTAGAAAVGGNVAEIADDGQAGFTAELVGYFWALAGKGVHMVCCTDWLASTNAERVSDVSSCLACVLA